MSDAVKQLESLLHDQPQQPLRPVQVEEMVEERERLDRMAKGPAWQSGPDRGIASKTIKRLDKALQDGAPKELDGARQDKVAKLCDEILATTILPSMLPQSTMRRNPAGAVDTFRRREASKPIKNAIKQWKRGQRALDPSNTDNDYTNLERFRPEGLGHDGNSTFMVDAQIPGKFAMSPLAKQNWPLGEPTVETAVSQVAKREMSAAQRAGLAKAQAARRAKKSQSTASQNVPAESGNGE